MLVALTPVRNEEWILAYSASAALTWVDHIVFLDHASTDSTPTILASLADLYPGRVTIEHELDPTWAEMNHRQRLLDRARELGATHLVLLDADEVLSANLRQTVRSRSAIIPAGFTLEVPLLNCWRSLDQYRNDEASLYGCTWATLIVRDAPGLCWKPRADGYQHHGRRPTGAWPGVRINPSDRDHGGLLHLQHASWRRMVAKHRLYKLQEVLRWPHRNRADIDLLYSRALDESGAVLHPVPPSWWDYGLDRTMIELDAEPWQEQEASRLLAEHGADAFADLDLFLEHGRPAA